MKFKIYYFCVACFCFFIFFFFCLKDVLFLFFFFKGVGEEVTGVRDKEGNISIFQSEISLTRFLLFRCLQFFVSMIINL